MELVYQIKSTTSWLECESFKTQEQFYVPFQCCKHSKVHYLGLPISDYTLPMHAYFLQIALIPSYSFMYTPFFILYFNKYVRSLAL